MLFVSTPVFYIWQPFLLFCKRPESPRLCEKVWIVPEVVHTPDLCTNRVVPHDWPEDCDDAIGFLAGKETMWI